MVQKNSITIALAILVGIFGIYSYKKFRIAPKITFPEIEVINENQETVKLKTAKGKLTVISFYASWCPDCKIEFPKINSARETNFSSFDFIAITDEGFEKMKKFQDNYKYPFNFYSLLKPMEEYEIYAIPTTYILNSKNEIVHSKVGAIEWEDEKFISKMKDIEKENNIDSK